MLTITDVSEQQLQISLASTTRVSGQLASSL
jgi:hypothetical protein